MSAGTRIEWTDATWNPVGGCTRVSPGCANCYALKIHNRRFKANVKRAVERPGSQQPRWPSRHLLGLTVAELNRELHGPAATAFPQTEVYDVPFTQVRTRPEVLDRPLRMRRPQRIFVNSMSDLFHEDVADEFIDRVFATMAVCGVVRQTCRAGSRCTHNEEPGCWMRGEGRDEATHTFQILTKRPERMREYIGSPDRLSRVLEVGNDPEWALAWNESVFENIADYGWPLPNVWLGVSAEDQQRADERIPVLLDTPAAVRFISCEPLLGAIDLREHLRSAALCGPGLDWVIVGGESGGPRAQPERRLVTECCRKGSPFGPGQRGDFGAFDRTNTVCAAFNAGECTLKDWRPTGGGLERLRSLRDQCAGAGVPFFFKQWGGPRPTSGGRGLDGREWNEFPAGSGAAGAPPPAMPAPAEVLA